MKSGEKDQEEVEKKDGRGDKMFDGYGTYADLEVKVAEEMFTRQILASPVQPEETNVEKGTCSRVLLG